MKSHVFLVASKPYKKSLYCHTPALIEYGVTCWNLRPCLHEGHRPNRVNFSEHLSEKKLTLLARANNALACSDCQKHHSCMFWLPHLMFWVDPAGQTKVFIWPNVDLAKRMTLPLMKGCLAKPTFCFSCKRFTSWCLLIQGSLHRRVTLLPGKTFLHINRAKDKNYSYPV